MMQLGRQWTTVMIAGLGTIALLLTARPSLGQTCTGDCNATGDVTIDDILKMVNIALGTSPLGDCTAGDANTSGDITIEEILQAVNNAQTGCTAGPTPTPTGPTPTPSATATLGVLGTKHFVLDPRNSQFRAAISPGLVIPLGGGFRGQTNGVLEDAYLDFEVGQPNAAGLATVNITGSSEYLVVDARSFAPIYLCLKPILPVMSAGAIDCNGGGTLDFSIKTSIDHNIGVLGVDGFTAQNCQEAGGQIEGPNQLCATGKVGDECAIDTDCDTASGPGDGACGLRDATCTAGKVGACRNDGQCDSSPTQPDGVCGQPGPHPGVCNGPLEFGQSGVPNRPGEMTIAPLAAAGLNGLPLELNIEQAPPCGDEGPGMTQAFAMTTGVSTTELLHFGNTEEDFPFSQTGLNFDCHNFANSPGRFVLSFGVLHQFNGGDIITGFEFGSALPTATPTPTRTPTAGS